MESGSIRFRLVALWGVLLVIAIGAAFFGLQLLFERSILRRTLAELSLDVALLSEALNEDAGNVTLATAPSDPLFSVAYGGRYWQISRGSVVLLRSPSLWDFKLAIPAYPIPEREPTQVQLDGPDGQHLFSMMRLGKRGLTILAAVDFRELQNTKQRFADDLLVGLSGLALILFLAAWAHVLIGLQPLRDIQSRLARVRNGEIRRLDGSFPTEVMPLVTETNALLDAQDTALSAARTHAGNLAHGLNTPLAVMATHARALRRRGDADFASQIEQQIEMMRRHVQRELARTRARGGGATHHQRINTAASIREVTSTLQLLPKGQALHWDLALTEPLLLAVDGSDFQDLMGNLIDNAQKWAKTTVRIQSRLSDLRAVFVVEDDGPGVAPTDMARILERGVRADTSVAGTGLGLAIVSDLVGVYEGRLEIGRSALGGLSAMVTLGSMPIAGRERFGKG